MALAAALVALILAILRDYSVLATLQKTFVSYLVFFLVASVLLVIFRVGVLAEGRPPRPERKAKRTPRISRVSC